MSENENTPEPVASSAEPTPDDVAVPEAAVPDVAVPEQPELAAPSATTTAPAAWMSRNRVIAASVAAAFVIGGAGGFAVGHSTGDGGTDQSRPTFGRNGGPQGGFGEGGFGQGGPGQQGGQNGSQQQGGQNGTQPQNQTQGQSAPGAAS